MKQKDAEELARRFGITLKRVSVPAGPGWYWARQTPAAGQGDSCGWRPVEVCRGYYQGSLEVTRYGDRERLVDERSVMAWEWGPRLEPPEEAE
jgi:hypothetical protein